MAADLVHGLKHYQAGRSLEALWWWQYSYVNHWGTHGGAALRALHAVVAHARLDVVEESTPAASLRRDRGTAQPARLPRDPGLRQAAGAADRAARRAGARPMRMNRGGLSSGGG